MADTKKANQETSSTFRCALKPRKKKVLGLAYQLMGWEPHEGTRPAVVLLAAVIARTLPDPAAELFPPPAGRW